MTLRSLQICLSIYYGYMLAGSLSILTRWFYLTIGSLIKMKTIFHYDLKNVLRIISANKCQRFHLYGKEKIQGFPIVMYGKDIDT